MILPKLTILFAVSLSTFASIASVDGQTPVRKISDALELAGNNRNEIQKAVDGCQGSKLEAKSIHFLIQHMPEKDLKSLSGQYLITNVKTAIKARLDNEWSKRVPEEIFLNDVLPYASINENRDDWRTDFYDRFHPLVKDCKTTGEAAQELNKQVFNVLKVRYSTKRKKPDQSPYESMETGLASCTGLSVILTDACRAVGVPARLAGTPLWVNKRGNHTWVEVWDEGHWKFTGACEYDANGLNRGWFKGIASQADPTDPRHKIYATSFKQTGGHFPMVWKWRSKEVPGVDVTSRYIATDQNPKQGFVTVAIQLVNEKGTRLSGDLIVLKDGKPIGSGKSRTESNDANDYFELELKPGTYTVKSTIGGENITNDIEVTREANQVHRIKVKPSGKGE